VIVKGISALSGLGSTMPLPGGGGSSEVGGSTWALCHSLPSFIGIGISQCRDAYANDVAAIYDNVQYGGRAPAPSGVLVVGGTKTPAEIAAANQEIIRQAEAQGYHPDYANEPTFTASNISDSVDNTLNSLNNAIPYAIGAGILILAIMFTKR
jgi:hypothetical protein